MRLPLILSSLACVAFTFTSVGCAADAADESVGASESAFSRRCTPSEGADAICFTEVPFVTRGAIARHWRDHGGLEKFGYPIENQKEELVEGKRMTVQYFQRQRLEIQRGEVPGIPAGAITYGRLGAQLFGQTFATRASAFVASHHENASSGMASMTNLASPCPEGIPGDQCSFYKRSQCEFIGPSSDRGQYVCGAFLRKFKLFGGVQYFGYPVSPYIPDAGGEQVWDGAGAQWFERARMESHPENMGEGGTVGGTARDPDGFYVLFGLLTCEAKNLVGRGNGC